MTAIENEIVSGKKAKTEEIVQEIVVTVQLLIKMGFEEEVENEKWLVEVLNMLGFTSTYGKPLTYMGYRKMMERADQGMIRRFIEKISHEPVAVLLPF
jgi:hypothetical protein